MRSCSPQHAGRRKCSSARCFICSIGSWWPSVEWSQRRRSHVGCLINPLYDSSQAQRSELQYRHADKHGGTFNFRSILKPFCCNYSDIAFGFLSTKSFSFCAELWRGRCNFHKDFVGISLKWCSKPTEFMLSWSKTSRFRAQNMFN